MRTALITMATFFHRATTVTCMICLLIVLLSMIANVVLRHGLSIGSLELQDLTVYAFSILAILSIPCAIAEGRHVKIEPKERSQRAAKQKKISVIAALCFLLPITGLLFAYALPQFWTALIIREGSSQIGGLEGLFIVKAFVPVGAFLMALQGIAALLDSETSRQGADR